MRNDSGFEESRKSHGVTIGRPESLQWLTTSATICPPTLLLSVYRWYQHLYQQNNVLSHLQFKEHLRNTSYSRRKVPEHHGTRWVEHWVQHMSIYSSIPTYVTMRGHVQVTKNTLQTIICSHFILWTFCLYNLYAISERFWKTKPF